MAPDSGGFTLDHVEFFVPDRTEAAAWYAKLAIFSGAPQGSRTTAGFHRVAFRLDTEEWAGFVARIAELGLEEDGRPARVVDHKGARSVYFTDPYGHRLEVTTYET